MLISNFISFTSHALASEEVALLQHRLALCVIFGGINVRDEDLFVFLDGPESSERDSAGVEDDESIWSTGVVRSGKSRREAESHGCVIRKRDAEGVC